LGIIGSGRLIPFFTQLMGNRIGNIDPVTMQVREYFLGEGTGPRRLAVMPDDIIYCTDYARGTLGRLDPATGRTAPFESDLSRHTPARVRAQPSRHHLVRHRTPRPASSPRTLRAASGGRFLARSRRQCSRHAAAQFEGVLSGIAESQYLFRRTSLERTTR